MIKNIHFRFILLLVFSRGSFAQDTTPDKIIPNPVPNGFYQKINLDADSPCKCDQKTERTYQLSKGLIPKDVIKYNLYAYKFSFGSNLVPVSKLFKAFENDPAIY